MSDVTDADRHAAFQWRATVRELHRARHPVRHWLARWLRRIVAWLEP